MSQQNYSRHHAGKFIDQLILKKRKAMYAIFIKHFLPNETQSILDVGATADQESISSNYLEELYPYKHKLIVLSNQNTSHLQRIYPELTCQHGDARALPFKNNSIDIVFSSAVIEHVGSRCDQLKMLTECIRVAKYGVFITTPNRWYPIEVHTIIPLIHWLPKKWHRMILNKIGLHFYALENNLNLLDKKTLILLCHKSNIFQGFKIDTIRTFGLISNLILMIKK